MDSHPVPRMLASTPRLPPSVSWPRTDGDKQPQHPLAPRMYSTWPSSIAKLRLVHMCMAPPLLRPHNGVMRWRYLLEEHRFLNRPPECLGYTAETSQSALCARRQSTTISYCYIQLARPQEDERQWLSLTPTTLRQPCCSHMPWRIQAHPP